MFFSPKAHVIIRIDGNEFTKVLLRKLHQKIYNKYHLCEVIGIRKETFYPLEFYKEWWPRLFPSRQVVNLRGRSSKGSVGGQVLREKNLYKV